MNQNTEEEKLFFPENVQKDYLIGGVLGWPDIKRYVLPSLAIAVAICLIPPYTSVILWIFKIFFVLLLLIANVFMIFLKPVPTRKNISMEMWLKDQIAYSKRQKVYFIDKKDKTIYGK